MTKSRRDTSDETTEPVDREMRDIPRDREQTELDRRHDEALDEWRRNGAARREFATQFGMTEHLDWQAEMRNREQAAGQRERKGEGEGEFGIEYEMAHPDGGPVRYDYVDFRSHTVVDRKPIADGETYAKLSDKYAAQRGRHVEAYQARYGVAPEYYYALYPSTKDLDASNADRATTREPRDDDGAGDR